MSVARVSVMIPRQPFRPDEATPFADMASEAKVGLWMGQSFGLDAHPLFAYLAGRGFEMPVGIGVALAPLRHPYDAALQARSLALLGLPSVSVAYGSAEPNFVRALIGAEWEKPVSVIEEYLTVIRALLDTGFANLEGKTYSVDAILPHGPSAPVRIGAGVLRPRMAAAAGRVGDFAITWLVSPEYLRRLTVELRIHSSRPSPPEVVAILPFAIARPGRHPLVLARAATERHLRAQHYRDMLDVAGVAPRDMGTIGVVRRLLEESVFAYGSAEDIVRCIEMYAAAGADEVVLSAAGVSETLGARDAQGDLEEVLAWL